jgi:hypothetical protein
MILGGIKVREVALLFAALQFLFPIHIDRIQEILMAILLSKMDATEIGWDGMDYIDLA